MIRHIVLVRFASQVTNEERDGVFAALRDLKGVVSGIVSFAAGPNVSPEGLDKGFGHVFVVDFTDVAARDSYLVHPDHQSAGAQLVSLSEGGLNGLIVIDVEI